VTHRGRAKFLSFVALLLLMPVQAISSNAAISGASMAVLTPSENPPNWATFVSHLVYTAEANTDVYTISYQLRAWPSAAQVYLDCTSGTCIEYSDKTISFSNNSATITPKITASTKIDAYIKMRICDLKSACKDNIPSGSYNILVTATANNGTNFTSEVVVNVVAPPPPTPPQTPTLSAADLACREKLAAITGNIKIVEKNLSTWRSLWNNYDDLAGFMKAKGMTLSDTYNYYMSLIGEQRALADTHSKSILNLKDECGLTSIYSEWGAAYDYSSKIRDLVSETQDFISVQYGLFKAKYPEVPPKPKLNPGLRVTVSDVKSEVGGCSIQLTPFDSSYRYFFKRSDDFVKIASTGRVYLFGQTPGSSQDDYPSTEKDGHELINNIDQIFTCTALNYGTTQPPPSNPDPTIDTQAPIFLSGSVTPESLEVCSTVKFISARASDDKGIASVSIRIVGPSGRSITSLTAYRTEGSATSGVWGNDWVVPCNSPTGVYVAEGLASDAANNATAWIPLGKFQVLSASTPDTSLPVVVTGTISNSSVRVCKTISEVKAQVSDDSRVSAVTASLVNSAGSVAHTETLYLKSGTTSDGSYSNDISVPCSLPTGSYSVRIRATDQWGKQSALTAIGSVEVLAVESTTPTPTPSPTPTPTPSPTPTPTPSPTPTLSPSPTVSPSAFPTLSVSKLITITCVKGKLTRIVTSTNPRCPRGYKKK